MKTQVTIPAAVTQTARARYHPLRGETEKKEFDAYIQGYSDAITSISFTPEDEFFDKIAEGLIPLWPKGNKDGKWAWRDSQKNIVKRLKFVWREYDLKDKYTVDECLQAARRYVSQFEDNAKYMKTLPYFIFKHKEAVSPKGKTIQICTSSLIDMLKDNPMEWEDAFNSTNTIEMGGELI